MLKSLKPSDIDAITAACAPDESGSDAEVHPESVLISPGRDRVYGLVEHLSREAQEELLALMWTGGPKNGNSFEENLELARKTWDENHASHIAEQHARLPNYLSDGLKRMPAGKA
jgi:hypothetical protein